jgi:RHH-type proline utilization regulon transcriptional repressor/proline dehydrogenase/delta 1-pyrroline-5-carboxylate dehydrogenase
MSFTDHSYINAMPLGHVSDRYLADEETLVNELLEIADSGQSARTKIECTAATLVRAVRRRAAGKEGGIDAFLQQYDLSSQEGVLLMCIAEALLRIPDAETADRLIADKITSAQWQDHLGASDSLFVNASTWGLMLTGQLLTLDEAAKSNPAKYLGKLASRAGEPVVRTAMRRAMRIMGHQFVMGRTIDEALARSQTRENKDYRHSFDMLGEAALTAADAARYLESYGSAIDSIGGSTDASGEIFAAPSISVKLSALHPRFSYTQHDRVMKELAPSVAELAVQARDRSIALTIDAEEADRLEISLEVFEQVYRDKRLADYEGLGLAVQTYLRTASDVLKFLTASAETVGRKIPVRLVKGAYWDTEIKHSQELGLESYPVFTRKAHTDVSYLACARQVFSAGEMLYPQFATHNAHTLASILHFAGPGTDFEFQRLHGMGEDLYAEVIDPDKYARPCRVYAPVGSHEDLLPYLVRRLLENGANTSFVNRIIDESVDVKDIVADPIDIIRASGSIPHPRIPSPLDIFQPERKNSRGLNLPDRRLTAVTLEAMQNAFEKEVSASAIVDGQVVRGKKERSVNPANTDQVIGVCETADTDAVDQALDVAATEQGAWDRTPARERAAILERAADLFEEHSEELMAICVAEAGKTVPDSVSELREAVDFLRYYAVQAIRLYGERTNLPGPTGEKNQLGMRGRGVFVCISPWNFPLAIFTGQIAAALASGNAVLAKPAEQTPLVAHGAIQLLLKAGVPKGVLHFLPGHGARIGGHAVADPRVAGVAFTGSTETARLINQALAAKEGPIATLIAETGGQNAMFVDSSALPEQVVLDSVYSAFNSAGQRCSALRLLCLQEDIAPRVIELLSGHMEELCIGDPSDLATDVGPTIDAEAKDVIANHVNKLAKTATVIHQCELSNATAKGTFYPPTAIEIDSLDHLEREVFGPVLHIIRFPGDKLGEILDAVNKLGYGLTMGVHSRIDSRARAITESSGAGNIYINRNMIGAVVGVQPFGGRGLSGTGPKAGGPNYLTRFGSEYTVSNNISAVGGNASLLSLDDD